MTDETISATTIINAPAEAIFAVLADPAKHAAIDGTGWVREPFDSQHLTEAGQVFRMAMYNDNVPGGHYRMANRVQVFDPPRAISWEPGMETGDGSLQIVGHIWRYDLAPAGPSAPGAVRARLTAFWFSLSSAFPAFSPDMSSARFTVRPFPASGPCADRRPHLALRPGPCRTIRDRGHPLL